MSSEEERKQLFEEYLEKLKVGHAFVLLVLAAEQRKSNERMERQCTREGGATSSSQLVRRCTGSAPALHGSDPARL